MQPWGGKPCGLLIYTADGHVSVSINRNVGSPNFRIEADCLFYAGTYKVIGSEIVHHILSATDPERIDREMKRTFLLMTEDLLLLSGKSQAGRPFKLTWKRR